MKNYLKEINAFYDRLETNPLSTSAIALWHALMHVNNKCGWKEDFSAPIITLSLKSGLSERTISNARNELKTKGYIDFKSRGGNRSAIYTLLCLSANNADNVSDTLSDTLSDSTSDSVSDTSSAFLNKTKGEEEEEKAGKENPHFFFQNNFGVASPYIIDCITTWCNDTSDEIVVAAMKLALSNGVPKFSYVESVLKDWSSANLSDLDSIRAYERQRKKQKNNNTIPFPKRISPSVNDTQRVLEQLKKEGSNDT